MGQSGVEGEKAAGLSVAEREALEDPVLVGGADLHRLAQSAAAPGTLVLEQVPFARAHPHDLAGSGDLEALGDRLAGLVSTGTSHRLVLVPKKSAQAIVVVHPRQEFISARWIFFPRSLRAPA